jgi:hypothetical protein
MLQFLSHTEELEVNERILTTILCKPSVSVPYNLHDDAEKIKELVPYQNCVTEQNKVTWSCISK